MTRFMRTGLVVLSTVCSLAVCPPGLRAELLVAPGYALEVVAQAPPWLWIADLTFSPAGRLVYSVGAASRVPCDSYIGMIEDDGTPGVFAEPCIDNPISVAFKEMTGELLFFAEGAGYSDYLYSIPFGGTNADLALLARTFVLNRDLVADTQGNLFLADIYRGAIFKIDPYSRVTIFAGGTSNQGDGFHLDIDANDVLYFTDAVAGNVYTITPGGQMSLLTAAFEAPNAIAVDPEHMVYVSDGLTVYTLSPAGEIATLATGEKVTALADGPDGAIYALTIGSTIYRIVADPCGALAIEDFHGEPARFNPLPLAGQRVHLAATILAPADQPVSWSLVVNGQTVAAGTGPEVQAAWDGRIGEGVHDLVLTATTQDGACQAEKTLQAAIEWQDDCRLAVSFLPDVAP
ncbi:MAG: hypothetical protein AB1634_00010 [Thermodesulfobacteriota bacterium]